jgi:hypothetical protein
MPKLFTSLTQEEKVDFFVKCQDLLIKYHPKSEFLAREKNIDEILDRVYENISRYKGYCYMNDNMCVLWNHVYISDSEDVNKSLKDNAYKPPHPDYNGVSFDFVALREKNDMFQFIRENKEDRIKYILSVKRGVPRFYPIESWLKSIGFSTF